ncbi:hypothetical protein KFK09_013825 [Dendrobium nobile]|uniref:Aminotransferase-like plant mobile domain-containing protein n=1 Tax=Dendrobium nobile TaxID=94219 RepID=A0A8T3B8I2_DENNO|nr:hypothetical protein KFK09_013825 [Dendrobium nobile]
MTITLQDVQLLLGLRVDGPAVVGPNVVGQGRMWPTWPNYCDELLGTHPGREIVYHASDDEEDVATFRMGSSQVDSMLPLRWLRWMFYRESYDDLAPEIFLRHVRAYIVFMISYFLIPDTSRSHVSLQWLPLFANVDSFSRMSIGGAVLAHLYRELWAEDMIRELPAGNKMMYRDEFDALRMSQVIMTPYTQEVLDALPVQYHEGQNIWRAIVPLINWKCAEWHLPDRVVRQFSGVPSTDIEPMDQSFRRIDGRGRADQDWTIQYRDYLQIWEERRAYVVPITPPADYYIRSSAILEPLAGGGEQNASSLQMAVDQVAEFSARVQQSVYIDYTTFDTATEADHQSRERAGSSHGQHHSRRSVLDAPSRLKGSRHRQTVVPDPHRHSIHTPSMGYDFTGAGPSAPHWSPHVGQSSQPGHIYYGTQYEQPGEQSLFPMAIPQWMSSLHYSRMYSHNFDASSSAETKQWITEGTIRVRESLSYPIDEDLEARTKIGEIARKNDGSVVVNVENPITDVQHCILYKR